MTFMPHELIKVPTQLLFVTVFHTFQFEFATLPIALNMLGMSSIDRINKIDGMVDSRVAGDIG